MNLVKWFRRNNRKVMAIVVVVILFGFVGGSYIRQLGRRKTGLHKTVAYFRGNTEITNYDLALAQRELEILKMLRADDMLGSIRTPILRAQNLRALILRELLFSEQEISPMLSKQVKQMMRVNKYSIGDKQINDIYRRSVSSDVYWLLLKKEAEQAGTRILDEEAGRQLAKIIPNIFSGATYSQLIGSIVNQQRIPEQEILKTFGKLMMILEYTKVACENEAVTIRQIMHNVSNEGERFDAEFLRFDSSVFAEIQDEPSEEKMIEHFNKYKKFFPGDVSEQNPYGFGYKLGDRIKLEYIAVKLDDVSSIITAPTQEEAEEYYQRYREQFTQQVPSDANDPNSPMIEQIRSYADIAGLILNQLLREKINSKAERILQQAKTLTETDLDVTDAEFANIDEEQFKQMADDYETAVEQLSKEYKIRVYTGRTEMLSAEDMVKDNYLTALYMQDYKYNPVVLTQIVFAVDELGISELGPFEVAKPKMYENIGLVKDVLGRVMVLVRIIETQKAFEPESINQTFSRTSFRFEQDQDDSDKVYSIKEAVVEDMKKLAAMDTVKNKTAEFKRLAVKDGWDSAIARFEELYGQKDEDDDDKVNIFKLQNLTNLQRTSKETIGTLSIQNAGSPTARFSLNEIKKMGRFINQLYSLVPPDANSLDTTPLVIEFKPYMSYYCIKNISIKRLEQRQYERIKVMQVCKENLVQSQSLAPVHFSPENILKRMQFSWVRQNEETADSDTLVESEGSS